MSILAAEEAARVVAEKVATLTAEKAAKLIADRFDEELNKTKIGLSLLHWIGMGTVLFWGYRGIRRVCCGPTELKCNCCYEPLYIRKYY
jgi:hypothetical protein